MDKKRSVGLLLLILAAAILALPGIQLAGGVVERVTNGNFEEGFSSTPAGFVGNGWHWFHSGGDAKYGFYRDQWPPVVYSGASSQLIEINTVGYGASQPDHYAGIYQTVAVVPGKPYELVLHGMLRALEDDPDRSGYNYRVQFGVDYDGGTSWRSVTNWVEIPWNTVYPRLSPGALQSFSTTIHATGDRLTLFVRVWYKWATVGRELDVNLDGISLKGALPAAPGGGVSSGAAAQAEGGSYSILGGDTTAAMPVASLEPVSSVSLNAPPFPVVGWRYEVSVQSQDEVGVTRIELFDNGVLVGSVGFEVGPLSLSRAFSWTPATAGRHVLKAVAHDAAGSKAVEEVTIRVGRVTEFVRNGSFESGFWSTSWGVVGEGWTPFTNGGRATYGFYDETWPPVVADGEHSQMIEINTYDQGASEPDRYAGILQLVEGLTRGATYRFSLQGMLRVLADDPDRLGYSYRVQWGYTQGSVDWRDVKNWAEIPWDSVHTRLEPGAMAGYTATFQAPSSRIVLFVRVWKKWGTVMRELDANLDAISLQGYK